MYQESRRRFAALLLAIALFVLATPMQGRPCGWCVKLTGFTLSHPRSVEIALATRAAIEKGILHNEAALISTKTMFGEGNGLIALKKVPARRLVEAWTKSPDFADSGGPVTVHFLFISSRETCEIEIRKGVVLSQAKPSERCDLRVVTTKEAMAAILEGRISVSGARELGLLVVEGEDKTLPLKCLGSGSGRSP
jgi:hypothetical protein